MIFKRFLILLLAVALTAGLCVFVIRNDSDARGRVSLWCVRGEVLSENVERLAEEYNAKFSRKTLPVSVRIFDSEKELAAAFETGSPDILLCSHYTAFSLFSGGKLTEIINKMMTAPAYSRTVRSRSNSIGRSFFPVGFSIPVLAVNKNLVPTAEFSDMADFFSNASAYKEANGKAYYACESFSELFYTCLLRCGADFSADSETIETDSRLLELYNQAASTAFEGSIALVEGAKEYVLGGALPCAFVMSSSLRDIPGDELGILDIPQPKDAVSSDTLGVAYGFAITNGGCRSTGDTAAFMSWLFAEGRAMKMARENALATAENVEFPPEDDVLSAIAKKGIISLPNADSDFVLNKNAFDSNVSESLRRLLP